ncbi:hypothetical protein FOPG_20131 [Fusarium oxysporum f. sp. conglutinans race 2 54008]|uniref:Uncharacterized protein n=1 Tax=Fusarium oxysporum f. sp. conglutinans race 2 54008 TaxID=1089457 RepID=X0GUJ0_FUSOX|nr:hypothetical protein FOPG_20131 [Fusarium oxysporum f. sp. conglutinans race 2 54008]
MSLVLSLVMAHFLLLAAFHLLLRLLCHRSPRWSQHLSFRTRPG